MQEFMAVSNKIYIWRAYFAPQEDQKMMHEIMTRVIEGRTVIVDDDRGGTGCFTVQITRLFDNEEAPVGYDAEQACRFIAA